MAVTDNTLVVISTLMGFISTVTCSVGDRSWIFQKCLRNCEGKECSTISDIDYAVKQPVFLRWLQWTCPDECDYNCMWTTVEAFQMDGTSIPQFHGKWPFIRFFGIQEPASALFSLLNGLSHLLMLIILRRQVTLSGFLRTVWHFYALIAINAWLWSTVFHTRDFPFTEMMDYVGAVSLVMFSMFALCARVLGPQNMSRVGVCGAIILALFVYHVHYLAFVKFDYGYNMKVNIAVGLLNAGGWIYWCHKVKDTQPYVWKAAISVLLVSSLVMLELLDFPPILWTFDAHSLWHAGTAPIPLLWYSFVIDDCHWLNQRKKDVGPERVVSESGEPSQKGSFSSADQNKKQS